MSKLLEQINTSERKLFQLKDLFEIGPQYGYTESASKEKIGPKFLRITDIQGNIVDWETVPYCKISENEKSKYILKKDDLVFARTGATTGMSYFINSDLTEDAVFASYLIRLRFNKKVCSPDLLKYFFQSRNYWGQVNGSLSGSAQPGINAVVLSEMQVKLPTDLPTQNKIAEILSAYDAKIENNNKIIKNLEATAQAIFNEWFINFRFPGYEKVKMVESEMGEIPEGWELLKLGNIFNIKYGKNLATSKISSHGKFPVYGAGGVIGFYEEKNVDGKVILITCRGNGSGTIWRTNGEGFVTNNSFLVLPKNNFNHINFVSIYFLLKNSNISSALSGSAQPQITIDGLSPLETILPSKKMLVDFQNLTTTMFGLVDRLLEENISLGSQRDQLLTKLI